MLETKSVGDKFEMLVTDLIHWENHQHNEKSRQHNDSATNITMSPTLSPKNASVYMLDPHFSGPEFVLPARTRIS